MSYQPAGQTAIAAALADPGGQTNTELRLRGPVLWSLRALWLLVVAVELFSMVNNLIALFPRYHTVCADVGGEGNCANFQLTIQQLPALVYNGLSLDGYAIYAFTSVLITIVVSLSVGLLLFCLKSDNILGLFASLWLVTSAVTADSAPGSVANILSHLIWPAMFILFSIVPNGRFVPRWAWVFPALFMVEFAASTFFPPPYNLEGWGDMLVILLLIGTIATQIYRYRTVSSPLERQQVKWFVSGFVVILLWPVNALPLVIPALNQDTSWYQLAQPASNTLQFIFIPVGISIALFRYRLWGIDVLINRALVYGLLTLMLGLIYCGLVFGGQALLTRLIGQSEGVVVVASTLVVAVLFQPLRHRIQNIIDRRFYRKKYDATRTLQRLNAALRQEIELERLCEQIVDVVQETMQPAQISLWLNKSRHEATPSSGTVTLEREPRA